MVKKLIVFIVVTIFLLIAGLLYSQSLPKIIITSPKDNEKVTQPTCYLKGVVIDDVGVISIGFNDVSLGVEGKNVPFNYPIQLHKGKNEIIVEAMNAAGQVNKVMITVFYEEEQIEKPQEIKLEELKLEELKKKTEKKPVVKKVITLPKVEIKRKVIAPPKEEKRIQVKKVIVERVERERIVRPLKMPKPVEKKFGIERKKFVRSPAIFIGNRKINCKKADLKIVNNRTMVALEDEYLNLLNIKVTEEKVGGKRIITLTRGNKEVKLIIGEKIIIVNNVEKSIEVAPYLSSDIVMLPFRAIFEGLGFTVHWDKDNYRVIAFIPATTTTISPP